MDIQRLLDSLSEQVLCSVCGDIYKKPKQLPCLHSFCLACLNNLARERAAVNGNIQCPSCQKVAAMPSSGTFETFPSSFYINSLLDVLAIKQCSTSAVSCGNCTKKSEDTSYCFHCSGFWCGECLNGHNIIRENNEHRVVALRDFQAEDYEDVFKRPAICKKKHHHEVLKYYCARCDVAACQTCLNLEHGGHKIKHLDDVSERDKEKIMDQAEKAKAKIKQYVEQIRRNEQEFEAIKQRGEAVKQEVNNFADAMIRVIRERQKELIEDTEGMKTVACSGLALRNEQLRRHSTQLQAELTLVENLVRRGTGAEMVMSGKQVEKQLRLLLNVEMRTAENGKVLFAEDSSLARSLNIGGIGRIEKSFTDRVQSTAEGEGLTEAVVGREARFVVTTKNSRGRVSYSPADRVAVEIKRRDSDEDALDNFQVVDNKNGTYRVSYFAAEPGDHDVRVTVNGEDVRGSMVFYPTHVKPRALETVMSFGSKGAKPGAFNNPWGVAVNEYGEIAVSDCHNNRVQVFSSEGRLLLAFGTRGIGRGQMQNPYGLAYDKHANLLVADTGNNRIQQFTRTGQFIRNFGAIGESDVKLSLPRGISSCPNGNIVVADSGHKRVLVFSPEGRVLLTFKDDDLRPVHCICHDNRFIVSYGRGNCIKVYNEHGNFLHQFGRQGKLDCSMGLAIDKSGRLLVCNRDNNRIQLFKLDGTFCSKFGRNPGYLHKPVSVAVLRDGKFAVTEWDCHRVQIIQ